MSKYHPSPLKIPVWILIYKDFTEKNCTVYRYVKDYLATAVAEYDPENALEGVPSETSVRRWFRAVKESLTQSTDSKYCQSTAHDSEDTVSSFEAATSSTDSDVASMPASAVHTATVLFDSSSARLHFPAGISRLSAGVITAGFAAAITCCTILLSTPTPVSAYSTSSGFSAEPVSSYSSHNPFYCPGQYLVSSPHSCRVSLPVHYDRTPHGHSAHEGFGVSINIGFKMRHRSKCLTFQPLFSDSTAWGVAV